MPGAAQSLPLLKEVSRSFYLTVRVLPRSVRYQVGLAYLLARTTDTIADTELVPLEKRMVALKRFRECIQGNKKASIDFGELAQKQENQAERRLLEGSGTSLASLEQLEADDRQLILEVLNTITSGQELDLARFAGASAEKVVALRTEAQLEDYTYRVAGCVGEFWTKLCRRHLFPNAQLHMASLLADGVRFGMGLQLVNILRDIGEDLHHGRCYLPEDELRAAGVQPQALLQPANEPHMRPVYDKYLARATAHLDAGWRYTNALPRGQVRLRLACAWPVLIGLETLALLGKAPVLKPSSRVKVKRARVKRIMAATVFFYVWDSAWRKLGRVQNP